MSDKYCHDHIKLIVDALGYYLNKADIEYIYRYEHSESASIHVHINIDAKISITVCIRIRMRDSEITMSIQDKIYVDIRDPNCFPKIIDAIKDFQRICS